MKKDVQIFSSLIRSFCPSIFGHNRIKAGLLLALASYSKRKASQGASIRPSHMLLLGDPGMGKSKLLQFASDLVPNSQYVCGPTLTSIGLTASVVNDHSGPSLEAGALVLCD